MSSQIKQKIYEVFNSSNHSTEPSTHFTYASYLSNLLKRMGVIKNQVEFLLDTNNSPSIILFVNSNNAYVNTGSKSVLFSALLKITGQDVYRDLIKDLRKDIDTKSFQQKQLPSRIGKELTQNQILAIHSRALNNFQILFISHAPLPHVINAATEALMTGLMTGVYPVCPPRRLQEYLELQLHGENPAENYFNKTRTAMVFNKHKNSKWTGAETLPFPVQLIEPLEFLASVRPKRLYLFLNRKGDKFSKAALSNKLTRTYGFSVDMLRSLFITEHNKDSVALLQNMELAKNMGHSVRTQHVNYTKKN